MPAATLIMAPAQSQTCDICEDPIMPGDRYVDDGSEIAHTTCVAHWFRANFGREVLS